MSPLPFTKANQKYHLFYVSIFFLHSFQLSSSFTIKGIEIDRSALNEFKANMLDPQGVMNSWNDTAHVCSWYGVTCGHRHMRVRALDLQSSQLVGSVSPFVGNMSFLTSLELQNNSLDGVLPPEIGRLRRLRNLNLANNSVGGVIPSNISHCSKLISLSLQGNRFVDGIPMEFGVLSNLQILLLSRNNLMGKIPPSLGNLTFLSRLHLTENNLVGSIPNSFAKLQNLNTLAVDQNQLSGVFPPSILNLSSISILHLGTNQFHGNLPLNLDIALPNLEFFSVGDNLFSGSIPASLTNITSLRRVYLLANKFTGEMPSLKKLKRLTELNVGSNFLGSVSGKDLSFISSMINATNLQVLMIYDDNFGGPLPETIGNLSSTLTFFNMDNNKISGRIPIGIGDLVGLEDLQVWNNKLSGNLPESIGKLQNLQRLVMNYNMLSGDIPFSIGNLTRLDELGLAFNNFKGQIPRSIGQCQQLAELQLQGNYLSGEIPTQVFELSSLSFVFALAGNLLSGSLPTEVGNLKNLGILDISENNLSGEIPYSLGSCINLETLYMQVNLFQKSIPPSLSSLRGLQFVDLSRNNLSGEIPEYFASFQLQVLNLSYNNFQGKLPTEGIFKNASGIFVFGNNKLCGGIPELKLPISEIKASKETRPWRLVIAIICGFVGLVLLSPLMYVFWYKKKKKERISGAPALLINSFVNLSYHGLFKATNGFSSENLIGSGSFGSVYKGTLDDRQVVAIKVLNLQRRGASKSFTAECEALKNTRHKNLVKVLTACSGIDNHGNDFKALVYELMANGSLEDWLHPQTETSEGSSQRHLNFSQRLNIAIDVASALEYLHQHCGAIMVHCDLKPSNVLIDDDMVGHVTDFGLAKFLPLDTSITAQSSSLGFRGTIGYAAPEYGMTNNISTSGDVYSFGILLLEMFTGKRPTDDVFKEGLNLHRHCKEAQSDNLIRILDPSLNQEVLEMERRITRLERRSKRRNKKVIDGLTSLFELGISCSVESPKNRPNIADVAAGLCAIRNMMI